MDKYDSTKIKDTVQLVCIVIIIFIVILGIQKFQEVRERNRDNWEGLIRAAETATTEEEENNVYNYTNDWLNSTNPIFDGVTSEQRQVLIDWKNDYEHSH